MIHILDCDDALLVCEKPVGVSSESPGLPELLCEQEGFTVYPVHRLDRTTGGACVLARSPKACAALQRQVLPELVVKEYLAVVSGVPDAASGTYTDLLYHDRHTNKTCVADTRRKGVREATCDWNVLETADDASGKITLVQVSLHSGRTHQIRIQFASRQLPLVGDRRYGSRIKAPAPALWSVRICFPHPLTGKTVDVSSVPPDLFPWSCFESPVLAPR